MLDSIQKLGFTVLAASCLGTAISLPLPSLAETGVSEGHCLPKITTGKVACQYSNGDKYIGDFVNGLPNGSGTYIYSTGARFIGPFRNGLPNGRGAFIFKDGTRIEGVFENGTIKTGTATFANGDRYLGQFAVDRDIGTFHGQGQLIFANGDRFEGQFLYGIPLGPGVFISADKTRCQGEFYSGNFEGRGTCNLPSGRSYSGDISGGLPAKPQ